MGVMTLPYKILASNRSLKRFLSFQVMSIFAIMHNGGENNDAVLQEVEKGCRPKLILVYMY
jgi:hypothetical protein